MKDTKCKTEGCKEMIDSNQSNSGLCRKCFLNTREYKKLASESHKKYYQKEKKKIKSDSIKSYMNNREKRIKNSIEYKNRRYKEDEGFRNRMRIGDALRKIITQYRKTGFIGNQLSEYGIDWKGIIEVLSPIPEPRSAYQVDHIIPLFKFDLTDIEQIQIAFAPENHRWLLKKENNRRDRK